MTGEDDQAESWVDPDSVNTKEDLDAAVRRLTGTSSASSIARRAGLGRSTAYAFLNGRELSPASFTKLVEAFDGQHRARWQAAWTRAADQTHTSSPPEYGHDRPPQPVPARFRWRWALAGATALATLVIMTIALVQRPNPDSAQAVLPRPAAPLPGAACPQPPLLSPAAVTAENGAIIEGVSIVTMSYTYTPAFSPMVEYGGGLSGPLQPGHHLFLVDWADPDSRDSTAAHHPGNGRYYPSPELQVSAGLCFHRERGEMGYGGFTGMRVRTYLMVVDDAHATMFERDGLSRDGYTDHDLAARGAVSLGYIDLQTDRLSHQSPVAMGPHRGDLSAAERIEVGSK